MATAERRDVAALLATLTPEQWEAPSLCEGWRVRDVVAHTISYDHLSRRGLLRRFVQGRVVRANQVGVDEMASLTTAELQERYRECLVPRGLTAGFGGMIALVDGTIHHQDVRRALDLPRTIPEDRLRRVLDATMTNPRLPARRLRRFVRFEATDLGWAHGTGPEVRGPGEALLMAAAGRPSVLPELEGPGVPLLAQRLH